MRGGARSEQACNLGEGNAGTMEVAWAPQNRNYELHTQRRQQQRQGALFSSSVMNDAWKTGARGNARAWCCSYRPFCQSIAMP